MSAGCYLLDSPGRAASPHTLHTESSHPPPADKTSQSESDTPQFSRWTGEVQVCASPGRRGQDKVGCRCSKVRRSSDCICSGCWCHPYPDTHTHTHTHTHSQSVCLVLRTGDLRWIRGTHRMKFTLKLRKLPVSTVTPKVSAEKEHILITSWSYVKAADSDHIN